MPVWEFSCPFYSLKAEKGRDLVSYLSYFGRGCFALQHWSLTYNHQGYNSPFSVSSFIFAERDCRGLARCSLLQHATLLRGSINTFLLIKQTEISL